jgi:hypothetical protein
MKRPRTSCKRKLKRPCSKKEQFVADGHGRSMMVVDAAAVGAVVGAQEVVGEAGPETIAEIVTGVAGVIVGQVVVIGIEAGDGGDSKQTENQTEISENCWDTRRHRYLWLESLDLAVKEQCIISTAVSNCIAAMRYYCVTVLCTSDG